MNDQAVTIRPADADDNALLRRLAELDSADVPPHPLLVAALDDEVRVALSLRDGSVIADPFVPTATTIALLRLQAQAQTRPRARRRWRAMGAHRLPNVA